MVDGVKDRLETVEKMVMDAESKPSKNDVKELVELYTYMFLIINAGKIKINLLEEMDNKFVIFKVSLKSFYKTIHM
jgi:hypothetical protein